MSGNSIIGLPNPIDRDAAANKNYVDNGGAITKLPNGKFTAVSDIDFNGFSLKNIPKPIDGKDAVNKAYLDDKTIQPPTPIPKPIITMWTEEKGPLGNGHYEFSFGNGCSGSEHAYGGYCMSAPGRIIRGSLAATENKIILTEELKVNIVVNGKEQVNHSIVKKSGDICSCTIFRNPVELKQFQRASQTSAMVIIGDVCMVCRYGRYTSEQGFCIGILVHFSKNMNERSGAYLIFLYRAAKRWTSHSKNMNERSGAYDIFCAARQSAGPLIYYHSSSYDILCHVANRSPKNMNGDSSAIKNMNGDSSAYLILWFLNHQKHEWGFQRIFDILSVLDKCAGIPVYILLPALIFGLYLNMSRIFLP